MKNFMHLNVEKRLAVYILSTCLVFMFLLFAAIAPDIMNQEGDNWYKPALEIVAAASHEGGAHH